jgi:hypothetical protein
LLCDPERRQIKGLAPFPKQQKFPILFNQHFLKPAGFNAPVGISGDWEPNKPMSLSEI